MAEAQLKASSHPAVTNQNIPRGFYRIINTVVSHGILILYSGLALFPMFLILINSFKDRRDLFRVPYQPPIWLSFEHGLSIIDISSTKGYEQVLARADVISYFGNSLLVTS